ncbi:response regulator [Marinospirillum alkaliphilum]|uniref:Response regulator receiver domain-containing protein n=1 Tax=Marinospirillum alkaliphilum DSM 21637 TaxID=1122209 RepID=A0A1K1XR72_9GAMM|nr:response regulator [Marinospirillum alkaliphilum]SFX52218.1 Response regulator receiver domain-containing protein [Marinospirillum alkaliphilum DSM 21637]
MLILVVDDDALAGEMTAAVLEDQGHQVIQAEDAVSAMEQLNEHPGIELIVSDMNMPLVSGVELFRELREQGKKLPFILLTGDDPAVASAQEPALDACIMKDFSLDETLPQAIAQVLAGYN